MNGETHRPDSDREQGGDEVASPRRKPLRQGIRSFQTRAAHLFGRINDMAGQVPVAGRERGSRLLDKFHDTANQISRAVLPTRTVSVFLLPTGVGSDDYVCAIDAVEGWNPLLNTSRARVQMIAWAATRELDRDRLSAAVSSVLVSHFRRKVVLWETGSREGATPKRLRRQYRRASRRLQRTLATASIRVHPTLRELLADICAVEGIPFVAVGHDGEKVAPAVAVLFGSAEYRSQVPQHLQPLLAAYVQQ